MDNIFDIILIGAGPNAINAFYQIKKTNKNIKIIILEKAKALNNLRSLPEVRWHSPMKELKLESCLNPQINENYIPKTTELISYYEQFINEHNIKIKEFHNVINITKYEKENGIYKLEVVNNKNQIFFLSKNIILCTGVYENKKKLENINEYNFCSYNSDLSHRNKKLVLVGGGGSSIDFIINLLPHNEIYWVIRGGKWKTIRPNLRKDFDSVLEKYSSNLHISLHTEIKSIMSDKSITLSNDYKIKNVDKVHILIGTNSKSDLFKKMKLKFYNECLLLDEKFQTSLKGIYAFGSIMSKWNMKKNKANDFFIENGHNFELQKILNDINRNKILEFMPKAFLENKNLTKEEKPSLKKRIIFRVKCITKKILRDGN